MSESQVSLNRLAALAACKFVLCLAPLGSLRKWLQGVQSILILPTACALRPSPGQHGTVTAGAALTDSQEEAMWGAHRHRSYDALHILQYSPRHVTEEYLRHNGFPNESLVPICGHPTQLSFPIQAGPLPTR